MYWGYEGLKISRGENQVDFTKKGLSLAASVAAAEKLLGPRFRDAGISGLRDIQETRLLVKPKEWV